MSLLTSARAPASPRPPLSPPLFPPIMPPSPPFVCQFESACPHVCLRCTHLLGMLTQLVACAHTYTHIQGTGGWSGGYDALGKPWQHPLMGGTKTGEPKALGVVTVEPWAPFATENDGSLFERQVREPETNSRLFPVTPTCFRP